MAARRRRWQLPGQRRRSSGSGGSTQSMLSATQAAVVAPLARLPAPPATDWKCSYENFLILSEVAHASSCTLRA